MVTRLSRSLKIVEVTKAKSPTHWYSKCIGRKFLVVNGRKEKYADHSKDYAVLDIDLRSTIYLIEKDCAKVIITQKHRDFKNTLRTLSAMGRHNFLNWHSAKV